MIQRVVHNYGLCCLAWFCLDNVSAARVQEVDATRVRLLPGSALHDRQESHRTNYLASWNIPFTGQWRENSSKINQ